MLRFKYWLTRRKLSQYYDMAPSCKIKKFNVFLLSVFLTIPLYMLSTFVYDLSFLFFNLHSNVNISTAEVIKFFSNQSS